jgi:hypothetical protein
MFKYYRIIGTLLNNTRFYLMLKKLLIAKEYLCVRMLTQTLSLMENLRRKIEHFFPFFIIENHDVGFDDYKICAGNLLEFKSCV